MTIAQQVKAESATAADAMARAEQLGVVADQDWRNETTSFKFADGSTLTVSGPTFEANDRITRIDDINAWLDRQADDV